MSEIDNERVVGANITFRVQDAIDSLKQLSTEAQKVRDMLNQPVKGQQWIQGADGSIKTLTQMNQEYAKFTQQMEQRSELHGQKMQNIQRLADQRLENENARSWQKMAEDAQLYQARMQKMLETRSTPSVSPVSSAFDVIPGLGHITDIAGGIALYHLVDSLMQIPQEAMAASDALTKLKQVLELSPNQADLQRYGDLNGILQELQQTAGVMAQTYGVDLDQVITAMSMIGRKFKDTADIISLTDNALQLYAVDQVPVQDAVTGTEALMSQFGLTTAQARQALYEITIAAHSFQSSATDLINGLERSGSAFATMKMNTSESIAAVATLVQMTSQSGDTIGNAWKSIENSIASPKSVAALKQLGIQVYDANGNLQDSVTILQELQKIWPKLSDEAKIHFATVEAGGKYQYGRLLTFLNDYSNQYQRALDAIKKANAQTQEELVATALESPTKQLEMTRASVQTLANTIQQQINPVMIRFLTELRMGTGYVNEHWTSIEHWLGTGVKLAEAYVAWKIALAAYNAVMNSAIVTQARFAAGTSAIIAEKQGFVAGMQAMGGAVVGFTTTIAASMAKMAAFLYVFQVLSTTAARAADPAGAKIGDLQSQLDVVNKQISDLQSGGGRLQGTWDNFTTVMGDLLHGDIMRGSKDIMQNPGLVGGGDVLAKLQQRQQELKGQLSEAQAEQQKQQADEIRKSLDQVNQIVADAMKNANGVMYGPQYPGKVGGGGAGGGSGGAGGGKTYLDQLSSLSQRNDMALQYYEARISSVAYVLDTMNQRFATANDYLKAHATDTDAASRAVISYNDDVKALNDHANRLASENWQLRQSLEGVTKQMNQVDADYKAGKINVDTHRQAIYQLAQEFDRLTQKIQDNDKAIQQDKDSIVKATADIKSEMVNMLQQAYQDQQAMEEQALSDIYQPQIDALTKQKDAVDALISSLQEQWAIQDAQANLARDQADLQQVMADKRFQIVNPDGSISWTYDTAKAQQLQDQITKDQREVQRTQLEQQKSAIEQELKNVQDEYNQKKQALDDYWSYKLGQDKLNTEVDNAVAKEGLSRALQDIQAYTGQMVSAWNAVQQAKSQALSGGSLASSLGGSGFTPQSGSLNSYWQPIQAKGGMYMQIPVDQIVSKYGVSKSAIKTGADGRSWVPWSAIAPYAYKQSGIASLDTGGYIPSGKQGLALLHQNEIVVKSPLVDKLDRAIEAPRMPSLANVSTSGLTTTQNLNISRIELPNVTDFQSFMVDMQKLVNGVRNVR